MSDDCIWPHEEIEHLFGVPPCAVEELPRTCTCGAALEYAEKVTFHASYDGQPHAPFSVSAMYMGDDVIQEKVTP